MDHHFTAVADGIQYCSRLNEATIAKMYFNRDLKSKAMHKFLAYIFRLSNALQYGVLAGFGFYLFFGHS